MRRQSSITFTGINSGTPCNEKLCGKYLQTFAYFTVKDRLPVILTKVIDQLSRDKEELIDKYGKDAEEDIKIITGKISKLKNEVQTNKPLVELENGAEDVAEWNNYLKSLEGDELVCWFHSPWLYTETYMYRRLWNFFETSKVFLDFDPFRKQKQEALEVAVSQLSAISSTISKSSDSVDLKRRTAIAIKFSLWCNRCDLSLSDGSVVAQDETLNVRLLDSYLLCDDSEKVFDLFGNSQEKIVDIVLDNAGLELFADLCLADHLITNKLSNIVRLRTKRIPWYVSDATIADFNWLLDKLPQVGMEAFATRLREHLQKGSLQVVDDKFWTTPFPYSEMLARDPQLYKSLSTAVLVIFKGDLNYRKLLGDINWGFSEPLCTVLGSFRPTNIMALRTIKSDLVCGLQPGRTEGIFQKEPMWMRTGEYGIIQLSEALS